MKKTLAIILTVFMIVPLLTMSITAAPAEADASVAGLTFNGDTTYGASEEYYPEKLLEDIPHTFSAWVRLSDAQMKQASAIASTYPAASRYTGYVHFELAAGGKPRLVWGDTNDSSANDDTRTTHDFTFNTSVKANTWTYITIVVDDGAAEVRCYIDGKLAETLTGAGGQILLCRHNQSGHAELLVFESL